MSTLIGFCIVTTLFIYGCGIKLNNSTIAGNTICSNYTSQPMSELEVGLVHEMVNNYEKQQLSAINKAMKEDAQSVWFDLETIKEFIYHLEMNAKQNNVSSDALGLRFYYASYPDTNWENYQDLNGLPTTYKKHHTIVAVSTIRRKDLDMDFDPTNPLTYNTNLTDIEEYSDPAAKLPVISPSRSSRSTSQRTGAQNHGSLIPPGNPSQTAF